MPVETGLLITGQSRGFVSSAPSVAGVAQSGKQNAPMTTAPSPTNTSTSPLDQVAQSKAARAQQAVESLKQANANWKGLRQSMAAMRLQRLVGIIKVLAIYGGDPRQVAKRAAELARELKGAVKEFADSGGDPSTIPGASVPPATGTAVQGQDALSSALNTIAQSSTGASVSSPVQSGFVFQASSVLAQLRTVVALSRTARTQAAKDHATQQFQEAAENAAKAIDQTKGSVNILT